MSMNMDVLNALWLSQKELNVQDIIHLTGFNRRKVYRALQNLKERNLVKCKVISNMKLKGFCYTNYSINPAPSMKKIVEYKLQKYQENGQ